MAASLRRNISFPAPRPSHPGARRRRQRITNQPSISSPTTAAAVIPRSSTAFGSQRSSEKHPSPQPLPRQIPIDDQALIALPRVPSSEAFGRRSPYTGSNARVGPASETLNVTGRLSNERRPTEPPRPRYRGSPSRSGRSYLPAPPSPASTNGAQTVDGRTRVGFSDRASPSQLGAVPRPGRLSGRSSVRRRRRLSI
jgi:hypothetical protein